ncbi:unnamed protein product [Sphagnum jensenii]|uniref:DNA methyltransferase 2 n=1 Tax=Sphagnum jensenii TaxID=128206 RepID=A0ABP0XDI3_9BRYO
MADEHASSVRTLRVLEFYSGIGGMRYALKMAGVHADVVEAFEINEIANDVYEHNFGHRPNQGNIQRLTVQQLDAYKAHSWLLSPPCQPYTRQGLRKDVDDSRAQSFLQMLEMLSQMVSPPNYILVENVVGFENSVTHSQLIDVLEDAGFISQEFILTPLQLGIPYSRPRYFCMAKRKPLNFGQPDLNSCLLCQLGPLAHHIKFLAHLPDVQQDNNLHNQTVCCRSISDFLESDPCAIHDTGAPPLLRRATEDGCGIDVSQMELQQQLDARETASLLLEADDDKWEHYKLPVNVVERWGDVFDIVTRDSRSCCCFTKSYGRYAKGTGSLLATKNESALTQQGTLDVSKGVPITSLGLRYFTPQEIANLHSFPAEFSFPHYVSLRQRYALLGNSLSVAVVAALLRYLYDVKSGSEGHA